VIRDAPTRRLDGRQTSRRAIPSWFPKQGAAAGLLAAAAGSLLPGCSSGTTATTSRPQTAGGIPLPRPNNPVTWPLSKDNPAIKSGLQPEQNATLRLFNWVAIIGYLGYRFLTRGERGGRIEALTTIAGEG
jgi:hypothetical protein